MTRRTAVIHSPNASRYLRQLCKHFGHKVPVDFTPEHGRIELPFGQCLLFVNDQALILSVEGPDKNLARLEQLVGSHLTRFAFREAPEITWQNAT